MFKWLKILIGTLRSVLRCRRDLALENLALRQRLAVLKQGHSRPRLTRGGRTFWVLASRLWPGWRGVLHVVQPDTVVRWHRQGFRYYWRWKSRRRGRPKIDLEVIHRRRILHFNATENPTAVWTPRQLLAACGTEETPRYLVRDRDAIYGEAFHRQARILSSYADYYNGTRTHISLCKDAPDGRPRQLPGQGSVVECDRVGGLHHEYLRIAA